MINEIKEVIPYKDKQFIIKLRDFSDIGEIDVEDLLQVDYNNILGDMITFPVLFNRIGNIKADIEILLVKEKFSFEVKVAQWEEEIRKSKTETVMAKEYSNGNKDYKVIRPTEGQIANEVKMKKEYRDGKYHLFEIQKSVDIIDSLYWSAKSKDKKLDIIQTKIQPSEFEGQILSGIINTVMIREYKNHLMEGSQSK
jgi:hypothetical protein